jgi:hypothetical protein
MNLPDSGFDVLSAVAIANEWLIDWTRELRHYSGVRSVNQSSDMRFFDSQEVNVGSYVEAEIPTGETLAWALGLTWDGSEWEIDAYVSRSHRDGDRPLLRVAELRGTNSREFISALGETVKRLIEADVSAVEPALGVHGDVRVGCEIVKWIADEPIPGWVEARLTDAHGKTLVFHDKPPIFELAPVTKLTKFPVPGQLRCEVLGRQVEGARMIVNVRAVDVDSDGEARLDVDSGQLF